MNSPAPRGRALSIGERELWAQVTRSIAPLRPQPTAPEQAAGQTGPGTPVAEPAAPSSASPARPAEPKPLAPLDRRFKQRLARGRALIDARLDLHGLTQTEAHHALADFLRRAHAREARIVLIITGKGSAGFSNDRGVLRRLVPQWLKTSTLRPYVVALEPASAIHGGEGAFYVRLRRTRRALPERSTE
jgi:DNA-nicking Smr family endonuclease